MQRPLPPTTRSSREGAPAFRNGADPAFICWWSRRAPSWFTTHRDMRRACASIPQSHWCGLVAHRLRSPPEVVLDPAPADHHGMARRGPQEVLGHGADAVNRAAHASACVPGMARNSRAASPRARCQRSRRRGAGPGRLREVASTGSPIRTRGARDTNRIRGVVPLGRAGTRP